MSRRIEEANLDVEEGEGGDGDEGDGAQGGEGPHQHRHQAAQTSPPVPLL